MGTADDMTANHDTGHGWNDRDVVDVMLDELDTWAIVGLSGDPGRAAYGVAAALQRAAKRIVPIHPRFAEGDATVLGERGYARLADVPFPIDVVDVFRRSEAAGAFADEAVALGAKGVWFQLGVVDEDAFARTWAAGVPVVMDTCPLIEWRKRAA
jgi:predicted CoA-binding protein